MTDSMNIFFPVSNKLMLLMSGLQREHKNIDGSYTYEQHNHNFSDELLNVTFTHSMIKQLIVYASMVDREGYAPYVFEDDLSKMIGFSKRTIQHNNQILETVGLLQWERLFSGCISIKLENYLENFMDLYETPQKGETEDQATIDLLFVDTRKVKLYSRTGYSVISDDFVNSILKIDDVNAVRLALRAYCTTNLDVNVKQETASYLSYSEIKGFLPGYLGYRKGITKLTEKVKDFVKIAVFDGPKSVEKLIKTHRPTKRHASKLNNDYVVVSTIKEEQNIATQLKEKVKFVENVWSEKIKEIRATRLGKTKGFVPVLEEFETKAIATSFTERTIESTLNVIIKAFKNEDSLVAKSFIINPSRGFRQIAEKI